MTKGKTSPKKSVKVIKKLRTSSAGETLSIKTTNPVLSEIKRNRTSFIVKLVIVVVAGSLLYLLATKYKSLILVGTINSSPVYRWELNSRMADKYGKQTFDEIVSDRLLAEQLQKNKITVTDKEVSDEMAKLVAQYGGQDAFNTAIAQLGLTPAKAQESIKQSIGLKKLMEKMYTITVTDADVQKYFTDNKSTFGTKKLEEVAADIKDTLIQQQIYTKSQEWFTNIRNSAKIVSFI